MKCHKCNLANFGNAAFCKRCGSPLQIDPKATRQAGNIGNSDGLLVVRSPYAFPDRCLKCNRPASEHHTTVLKYYPKYSLVSLLVGVLFYKKIKLKIPLCREHVGSRTNISMILTILLVMGVIALLIGLYNFDVVLSLFGGILIGISVLADIKITPLIVVKMSKDEMSIKGAGKDFLALLPVIEQ